MGAEDKLRHTARLTGWYQLIAERLCVRDFQDVRKKHQGDKIFARVQKYRRGCHFAFFESDPLKRAELILQTYDFALRIDREDLGFDGVLDVNRREDAMGQDKAVNDITNYVSAYNCAGVVDSLRDRCIRPARGSASVACKWSKFRRAGRTR